MTDKECPFCGLFADVFHVGEHVLGIWDKFPVTPGHVLLVTRRHVRDWFDATRSEQVELLHSIDIARALIEREHHPHGYNIGINIGSAAGQTVPHLHVHVIPRYLGDVDDPTGGVRHVIPAKANYIATLDNNDRRFISDETDNRLVTGEQDSLLPHLLREIDSAHCVDLAVSFILDSGVRQIYPHLQELLDRGGRLRLVTGDYLDVTEPSALLKLLDLNGDVQLKMFESQGISFHPKAYVFRSPDGSGTAFVGSSNLSETALRNGLEWNYKVVTSRDISGFQSVQRAFCNLLIHKQVVSLTHDWVGSYTARRRTERRELAGIAQEAPLPPPVPHAIQREALTALAQTRTAGNQAGLVVLATGLGKTWLSAFDSAQFKTVLFVAHREEILNQARATFRRIRPTAKLGFYTGNNRELNSDVLFASIQTLGRARHLRVFDPSRFDYIVIDEFHHAAAATYRRLIDHFRPKFLLGLTATPDRSDGGDLLALCQENLVFNLGFIEGIRRGQLSPFKYFGVPDEVDYSNIPWRSNRFDEEALTSAVATQARAENALEQYRRLAGKRALGFCCSTRHADFMSSAFQRAGLRAVAVHSGPTSQPRASSLQLLEAGELDIIFAVDIFNEGLDVPSIDTVMMLRPTESSILWIQQFGRGLRKVDNKTHLTVIDYIGNHRTFLLKPMTLLAQTTDAGVSRALEQVASKTFELPPGCEITYDLHALDLIRGLLKIRKPGVETLQLFYEDFRAREGVRPTASEVLHAGFNPQVVRSAYGSWLSFVEYRGDLSPAESEVQAAHKKFFDSLEVTPMTKSYKMLVLTALIAEGGFPYGLSIDALATAVANIAGRSEALRSDIGPSLHDATELRALLERNPIPAWTEGKGTGGVGFFKYEQGEFRFADAVPPAHRALLEELTRELVDWRLAEYLSRDRTSESVVCRVSHTSTGTPLIFLPTDRRRAGLPDGWTSISVEGAPYEANFVKVAVNVIRKPGSESNDLPRLLYSWFGQDAGKSGTTHLVAFDRGPQGYALSPVTRKAPEAPELWKSYLRKDIPPLFGLTFSTGSWQQGLVSTPHAVFLLVTLNKSALNQSAQYKDQFLAADRFQWESPNAATQGSTAARRLLTHEANGIPVYLFVRRNKLAASGLAAPFVYCGELQFIEWKGEKPITVFWKLKNPLSDRQLRMFAVNAAE